METAIQEMVKGFEGKVGGKEVKLFELVGETGIKALITNYGARLVSLTVPNKGGQALDVVEGFNTLEGYLQSSEPYYGATIGRYANRIAQASFSLDDQHYPLGKNHGAHSLHGGDKGFHAVVWDARLLEDSSLEMGYVSPDMEEGFPGTLTITVTYRLTSTNGLEIRYEATSDQPTHINLSHHTYWNLNGQGQGSILNHSLQILADSITPIDTSLIPTGQLQAVSGTPFDFRTRELIGSRIMEPNEQLKAGHGYDHNFVLNTHLAGTPVAIVTGDRSGVEMEVFTDQPGMQFYSGNFMNGTNTMKNGHQDDFRTAFALETQHFPDSPHQPHFPSTVLRPNERYTTTTAYVFGGTKWQAKKGGP